MAITSITIENFKGIGDAVTIPIRPITLLFGKNSSGKSTVLQALHYMREVCEHAGADPDRTHMGGDYIDLGGFRSLVHLHELNRKIRIRIEFDLTSKESKSLNHLLEHVTYPDSAWIEVVTSWNAEEHNVYTESYGYGLNGTEWIHLALTERPVVGSSDTVKSNGAKWIRLTRTKRPETKLSDTVESNGTYLNVNHPDIKNPIADDYKNKILNILSKLVKIVFKELRDIRYLGPIRKVPPRYYRPQQTPDESLWAEGLEAWNILGRDPDLVKEINYYMQHVLKLGYSISRQEIISLNKDGKIIESLEELLNSDDFDIDEFKKYVRDLIRTPFEIRMKIHDEKDNVDLEPIDVGLGISQVIPVLVGVLHCDRPDPKKFYLSKPPGGFFAVEQPELHLHPAAQVALGDIFIDSIIYNQYHLKVVLKRILDDIENIDHYEEVFEIMGENRMHPDIRLAREKYLNLESDIQSEKEKNSSPDIQSVIEKYLNLESDIQSEKEKNSSSDIRLLFEELSHIMSRGYRTMLIETHSEHLLLRLLRRVHETSSTRVDTKHKLTPNDLSVVYVQPTPAGAKFIPVSVTDDGDFDEPWPEGFFEERDSELFYHA